MSAQPATDLSTLLQGNQLWHAQELLGSQSSQPDALSTGFAALDLALPSKGWPVGQLNELICTAGGSGEWSLMQPAILSALTAISSHRLPRLILVNPPHEPFLPAWHAAGISTSSIVRVDTHTHTHAQPRACWATEQALHCSDVAVVVAWLPRAPADALRRLQLAASQSTILLFVIRPLAAQDQSSPAALRLVLSPVDAARNEIHIIKCRGSAKQTTLQIDLLSPSLRALLQARKRRSSTAPSITTTSQISPVFRMTPRSQVIGLLPSHLLFGNERAAEGPAMSVKAHHGLDRTPPLVTSFSTNIGNHTSASKVNTTTQPASIPPERSLKRAARHARSR
jgi:protein ImuA